MENVLDNYQEYITNISRNIVDYHAAVTGRQIIYCSLKRFQIIKEEVSDNLIEVNDAEIKQKENETIWDYKERRNDIKPIKEVLKEVYPEAVHLEPDKSIIPWTDIDGTTRIEIDEDYEYYTLMASIIISNQTQEYIGMDQQLQIVLPKLDEIQYKKNDKVIFDYKEKQYIYTVKEQPETYLRDVFLLNLNLMTIRQKEGD